jgi:aryl-alcohol dehydrogenase-like predicted oxidoreductase
MGFGTDWGWGSSEEESRAVFDAYVTAGGNFIDTANFYTNGTSEQYVGRFIAADRDRFVLATKYTIPVTSGDPNDPNATGSHRKNLAQSVEASLKRLRTDRIDLLYVHAWDEFTPIEEVIRALDDLVRAGKVLYVGVSNMPAWLVSSANTLAELRGWTPFVGLQVHYSLIERTPERELLPMARALDIGVLAYSVLEDGVLSGKYSGGDATPILPPSSRPSVPKTLTERNLAIVVAVVAIADELDCAPAQVALSWVRQQPGVVIPIVASRTPEQLEQNLGCLNIQLSPDHMQRLDAITAIEAGYPHDFLAGDVRDVMGRGLYATIDDHRPRLSVR